MVVAFKRHPIDLYPSPDGVIAPLLNIVGLPRGVVWECAAGMGALTKQLRSAGCSVVETDILSGVDFLEQSTMPAGISTILTNPPYKLSGEFVQHALDLRCDQVVMLLPFKWMGGAGPRWKLTQHISICILMGRLKMLPLGAIDKGHGGTVDFAWFVFRQQRSSRITMFNGREW